MSQLEHRNNLWNSLQQNWDLIIIGGGITGAGIYNYAARKGLHVLLLEAADFAFGTSSRSSKLIHGGLRYLKNKQFDVVKESVRERERLIKEAPGLVNKMAFIYPSFSELAKNRSEMTFGTIIYDLLVPKWEHRLISRDDTVSSDPFIRSETLIGSNEYFDSTVDDSRLVLRVIQEGSRHGGKALNYAKVVGLLKDKQDDVIGVQVEDQTTGNPNGYLELQATVVVNATGPWSDVLRTHISGNPRLRKLRGSHLFFPHKRIPISRSITMIHPRDHRALFVVPWEGTTFIGTTDLDQPELNTEAHISAEEVTYLLEAANFMFPSLDIQPGDIISTMAGLRPVLDSGANTPSQESRRHMVWEENKLVTISGGKLTIFRVMAADCLNFISHRLPRNLHFNHRDPIFDRQSSKPKSNSLSRDSWHFLVGRHGVDTQKILETKSPELLDQIGSTTNLWAELSWAAEHEAVVHLDDLLLRRVRLGLLLKNGGLDQIDRIKSLVQAPLGLDNAHWNEEVNRYRKIWQDFYYLP